MPAADPSRLRVVHRSRIVDVWAAGEGRPLLLFHGWGLSGRPYGPVLSALADRGYRALAPSLAAIDPPWSLDGLAEVAADVVTALDAAPAVILGHSFGGALAIRTASDFPHLASGLVLVNGLGVSPGRRALVRTVVPGPHWRIGMQRSTAAALLQTATRGGGWSSLAGAARWVLSSSLEPEMSALREAGLRSAVLWGLGDTLLPRWIGERSAELLGGTFEAIGPDGGWPGKRPPDHDWPIREPRFFAERVDASIAGLHRGRRPKRAG